MVASVYRLEAYVVDFMHVASVCCQQSVVSSQLWAFSKDIFS